MTRLAKLWRLIKTLLAMALFALGSILASIILAPVLALVPYPSLIKRRWTRRIISSLARFYLRFLRLIGLIRLQLNAIDNLDQPGQLIIANHPTLLDAILLMALLPHANFVVKAAMARNPVTACLVSMAAYIPNDFEGSDLINRSVEALQDGQSLVIFPEGTRTAAEQLKFQRGAAHIALQARCVIQPVLIDCQPVVLRKQDKWHQVPRETPLFTLRTLAPVDLTTTAINNPIDTSQPISRQARELTRLLQNKYARELQLPH